MKWSSLNEVFNIKQRSKLIVHELQFISMYIQADIIPYLASAEVCDMLFDIIIHLLASGDSYR